MAKTSEYYKKNPKARKRRLKQQAKYNKTKKGLALRVNANKLNRKLGTYGNRDGMDAAHYKGSKTKGRKQSHLSTEEADSKLTNDPITTKP